MSMAVITGASSGMGREFAKTILNQHPEIDEIVLIARRRERLEALAADLKKIKVHILSLDLTQSDSLHTYSDFLTEQNADVRLLVNNAGFGTLGNVAGSDPAVITRMTALNCGAAAALCALTVPFMKKGSAIINVSSIASFVPTPRMSVYGATKAFVSSFSLSLRSELKKKGINVLAVCPGPMDTEFLDVADITGKSKMFDRIPHLNPHAVAAGAVRQAFRNRAVYTPSLLYKVYRVVAKLLPHRALVDSMTC